ncbi:MAG: metallophosphoesterase [Gammaproteobacteria bacterium]
MPSLLQLTDCHIYADSAARFDGVDTRASLSAVLAQVQSRLQSRAPADALLLTGDLSMDGSRASYAWLSGALEALAAPVYAIPGNHDDPACWPRAGRGGFVATPAVVELPPWRLLLLDTRIDGVAHGALGAAQLAWLERRLAQPTQPYDVIFMHHPPLAVDSPWLDAMGLCDAARLWALDGLAARVRAIVCGHVHQVFDRRHGGVRVLTTPSTCVQFEPRSRRYATDARAPAYRVLELGEDGTLTTTVERVAMATIQSSAPRR